MTLRDYLDAEVEEGYRYELARGVLEVSEVPNDPHGVIVWNLLCALAAYHRAHPGLIHRSGGGAEFQLLVPEMISGRHPDVSVSLLATPKDDRGRRPASFAVEVVSPGAEARERDYVTKREEYLAYGLDEYWIVDPIARRVTILVREGEAWAERVVKGRQSAASQLREQIAEIQESSAEAGPPEASEKSPQRPESPRDFIHRRMEELDKKGHV